MPQISVVIPTYNRARYLIQAIDSVLAQTYTNYEIIVVDDGSTDNTKDVLETYQAKIQYIYQENNGVSSARNAGIRAAKGEWIALLDSDDLWAPNKLEIQFQVIKDVDVIYFHRCEWFVDKIEDAGLLKKCEKIHWPLTDYDGFVVDPILSVVKAEPYMTPALLCHRSCFEIIGFFEEYLSAGEDEDWLSRASLTHNFHIIPQNLVKIRYHQLQTGLNSEKSVRSLIKVFERMCERLHKIHPIAWCVAKRRLADKKSHLANLLFKLGQRKEAIASVWESYILNPLNISRLIKIIFFIIHLYKPKNKKL